MRGRIAAEAWTPPAPLCPCAPLQEMLVVQQPGSTLLPPPGGPTPLSKSTMAGSPGAAPGSPGEARAAVAAAAALGAIAPQLDSYFVLALKIDPPALTRAPAQPSGRAPPHPRFAAVWARSAASLLGHDHYQLQRRQAPSSSQVLWLLTLVCDAEEGCAGAAAAGESPFCSPQPPLAGARGAQLLRLHAVRGLSAVVVSSFGGGMSSSSGGGTRPQVLLFGEHRWEPPAAAAAGPGSGADGSQLLVAAAPHVPLHAALPPQLTAWVTAETEFPIVHVFTCGAVAPEGGSRPDASATLLLRGRCFGTLPEEYKHPFHLAPPAPPSPASSPHGVRPGRQLSLLRTWAALAAGHPAVVAAAALAPVLGGGALLATADARGGLMVWDAASMQLVETLAPPGPALEAAPQGLAWLASSSSDGGSQQQQQQQQQRYLLLAAARGGSLRCWAVDVRHQAPAAPAWEAGLPPACSPLLALLYLVSSSGSDGRLLVAVGGGAQPHLAAWSCGTGPPRLLGTLPLLMAQGNAVTAAAAVPRLAGCLLVALSSGSLLLLQLQVGAAGPILVTVAALQLPSPGRPLALAADAGGTNIAAVCSCGGGGDGGGGGDKAVRVLVWQHTMAADNELRDSWSYALVAGVLLPAELESSGSAGLIAATCQWLPDVPVPCLAVSAGGVGSMGVLLLAPGHGASGGRSWRWVARLACEAPVAGLAACASGASAFVVATQGEQLLLLSEDVQWQGREDRSIAR